MATASHRPSDVIGAALVVTAWSALVATFLLRPGNLRPPTRAALRRVSPLMALAGIALLIASFVVAFASIVASHYGELDTVQLGRAFVAAASAIVGTVMTCVAALLIALQDDDLDTPPMLDPGQPTSTV